MSKKKSNHTAEEWDAHLKSVRDKRVANLPAAIEKERERSAKRWADPQEHKKRRDRMWQRKYGVDATFIYALLKFQNHGCAVCRGSLIPGKHMHVDHDHTTGEVRGLLCRACNQAEGHIRGSLFSPTEFAVALESYLNTPPASVLDIL